MRLTRIVPITLAVTLATAVVPAQAVGPFTHPQKALTADCFPALTVLDATGARHGFASCSTRFKDHLAFISAAPGAPWKVNRLRITGYVHAVADDGSSTYALYSKRHGTYVLKRTRGGAISHHRISKVPGGDGAIVARGGKWFAIWVGYPKVVDGTCPPLYSGGTLGHTRHGKATGFCGAYPSLALTSSGKPITAFQTGNYQLGNNIDLSTWRHRKWKKPAALARRGMLADISTSGATTNVVWLHVAQNSTLVKHPILATRVGDRRWHHTHFSKAAVFDDRFLARPAVTSSGGSTFVAWTVAKHKKERIRVEQSSGSGWTSRLLSDGTRHGDAVLLQLDDINGRAYIVMAHSDEKDYLLTTHQ